MRMEIERTGLAMYFDWAEAMPVRRIPPSYLYLSGRISSTKNSTTEEFEASLERDFLLMLEFDRGVARFAGRPLTIRWKDQVGCSRRYTPDVLVQYTKHLQERNPHLKPTLFEVKPSEVLRRDWSTLKPKFKAAIRWCREYDCRFRIVTDQHIRTPYLKNIKFLLQFRDERFRFVSDFDIAQSQQVIRSRLFQLGMTTPRQLLDNISANKDQQLKLTPYIWSLIRCSAIGVDLHLPLTMDSSIWSLEPGRRLARYGDPEDQARIESILINCPVMKHGDE